MLGTIAVLASTGLAAGRGRSWAQAQVAQATAHYQDKPNGDQKCADCRFFKPPSSCQLVEGPINPDGWCSFFNKKTA